MVVAKNLKVRRLHKAFLRYHDPRNWPVLREALKEMGRADLIGNGKRHLIPSFQPKGTFDKDDAKNRSRSKPFVTKNTGEPKVSRKKISRKRPSKKRI